jgi:hypothetical protein
LLPGYVASRGLSASSQIAQPSKIHRRLQCFLSGANAVVEQSAFVDCVSTAPVARGGALCVILPSSRDTAVFSSSFENCGTGSPDGADYGGACFLEVAHAELLRVCAARCSSTFGQFLYFAGQTQPRLSAVTLFDTADRGKSFGGVYLHRNRPSRLAALNFSDSALGAHGAALYNRNSPDCECTYLTVCHCRGATVVWSDASVQIGQSNFFRNDASTAVIWSAGSGLTVTQCVFMGNTEVEIDAVDGPVAIFDCVFDARIPRVATAQNNIVMGLAVSLDLAGENIGCRRFEKGDGWAKGLAADESTASQAVTTVPVVAEDDDLEEIVGIVFMCVMLCCLIFPPLYVILKYRRRLEKLTQG